MDLFFTLLRLLIQSIQPFLVPLCLVMAWAIVIMTVWNFWMAVRDGVDRAKQMHNIPCPKCRYFTGDYRLKCPVHPCTALSEEAINCIDYEPRPPANSHIYL